MKHIFWAMGLFIALNLVAACGSPSGANQSTTPDSTTAPPASATPLPLGCPNSSESPILSTTRISIEPDRGPVGTQIQVTITGARANCYLTLNIAVPPALSETGNTPVATPDQSYPVQWLALDTTGGATLTFCVCAIIPTWTNEHPKITSVTPQPNEPGVGSYAPVARDYFFFTLGAPDAPPASPFTTFTVTQ